MRLHRLPRYSLVILALMGSCIASLASAQELASPWKQSHSARSRLVAGSLPGAPEKLVAAVELELAPGWKTYWRNPGESGGVPPRFDWSASTNVAEAKVFYPAPHRMPDAMGDSIGYKLAVALPVVITPKTPGAPIGLALKLEYGVCREICVPVEAELTLVVPTAPPPAPGNVVTAMTAVPRTGTAVLAADPKLKSAVAALTGKSPGIQFEVTVPGGGRDADLFIEAPDGIYLPLPKKLSTIGDVVRFTLDLTGASEAASLPGKPLTLTMTSTAGASETQWTVH